MNPKVSIIVPCYNQEAYLAECLDSVLAQTYTDWECIIINDGSVDCSEGIAKSYVERDGRFHYIYQSNQGVVAARNNAIDASTGKFILPLDGDDKIAPRYLELAVSIMERDDTVGLVYCDVEMFGTKNKMMWLRPVSIRNILASGCCQNASFFRRKDFFQVGGYKEYMHDGWEDWDFFISLLEQKINVRKIEHPLVYYRIVPNSRDKSIGDKKELFSRIVSNHANSYYEEYVNLLQDYEKYNQSPLIRDTYFLINRHPFLGKMIHLNIIIIKIFEKIINIFKCK